MIAKTGARVSFFDVGRWRCSRGGLRPRLDTTVALDGVDLDVAPGEVECVLGPTDGRASKCVSLREPTLEMGRNQSLNAKVDNLPPVFR